MHKINFSADFILPLLLFFKIITSCAICHNTYWKTSNNHTIHDPKSFIFMINHCRISNSSKLRFFCWFYVFRNAVFDIRSVYEKHVQKRVVTSLSILNSLHDCIAISLFGGTHLYSYSNYLPLCQVLCNNVWIYVDNTNLPRIDDHFVTSATVSSKCPGVNP